MISDSARRIDSQDDRTIAGVLEGAYLQADHLIARLKQFLKTTGQPIVSLDLASTPLKWILPTGFLLLALSIAACDGQRQRLMTEHYPSYPDSVRRSIDKGNILRGMTEDQVYLALGSPVCKKSVDDEGRSVTVWLYPPIGRDACVTSAFRVYFEQGAVTTWDYFKTPTRYTDPAGGVSAY